MERAEYNNRPDTRARVEALRRSRKTHKNGEGSRLTSKAFQAARAAYRLGEAIRNPLLKTHTQKFRRRALRSRRAVSSTSRQHTKRSASQARPGMRHRVLHWVVSGRLLSFVVFLVTLWFGVHLFTASDFTVQQVAIEGNHFVQDHTIARLSGLQADSLWFVNRAAVQARIQQNTYIERAHVGLAFPNRAVIHVRERQPEVYWQVGNVYYLVDREGRVLEMVQHLPAEEKLVIEDTTHQVLQPDEQVDGDALLLAHALDARLLEEANLTPAKIGWNMGLGIYVKTKSQQMIVFGQNSDVERKLAVLQALLADETAFTYLDLRPSNPFYQNQTGER